MTICRINTIEANKTDLINGTNNNSGTIFGELSGDAQPTTSCPLWESFRSSKNHTTITLLYEPTNYKS